MRRIIFTLTALISAFLLSFTAAPATADSAGLDAGDRATTRTAERALPLHTIRRLKAGEVRNTGRFFVSGKAITAKGKFVYLQKSNRKAGHYRTVKKDRAARSTGRFRMTFDGPVGSHWRIVIKATNQARTTRVYIGRICRNC
jgi:hypothetical protein